MITGTVNTAAGHPLKGPEAFEQTRKVDTVVLDKTGTVTTGVMTRHLIPRLGVGRSIHASSRLRARFSP